MSKLELPDSPLGAASEKIRKLRGLTETLANCPLLALTTKVRLLFGEIVPLTVADERPRAKRIRVCADRLIPASRQTIIKAKILPVILFNITFFLLIICLITEINQTTAVITFCGIKSVQMTHDRLPAESGKARALIPDIYI